MGVEGRSLYASRPSGCGSRSRCPMPERTDCGKALSALERGIHPPTHPRGGGLVSYGAGQALEVAKKSSPPPSGAKGKLWDLAARRTRPSASWSRSSTRDGPAPNPSPSSPWAGQKAASHCSRCGTCGRPRRAPPRPPSQRWCSPRAPPERPRQLRRIRRWRPGPAVRQAARLPRAP